MTVVFSFIETAAVSPPPFEVICGAWLKLTVEVTDNAVVSTPGVVPPSSILDGPNPFIVGEEKKFSPHGYMMLRFEADRLIETVYDADGSIARPDHELLPRP